MLQPPATSDDAATGASSITTVAPDTLVARRLTGAQPAVRRAAKPTPVTLGALTLPEAVVRPMSRVAVGPDRPGAMVPITGLRCVVSLWIVLLHTRFGAVAETLATTYIDAGGALSLVGYGLAVIARICAFAFAGTSIFLVLGGYALASGTLSPEDGGMTRSAPSLWRSRLLRFVPLLVLTQALRIPQFLLSHGERPWHDVLGSIAVNLVGQQAWFPSYVWDLNDPSWTMTVLLSSWALFPSLGPRLARLQPRTALIAFAVVTASCILTATTFLVVHGETNANGTAMDFWSSWLHTSPLVRIPEFYAGVLVARVHRGYAGWIAPRAPAILAAGVLALLAACALNRVVVPYEIMHNGLLIPIAGLLFVGFAELGGAARAGTLRVGTPVERLGAALTRFHSRPALQRHGSASFSLYLVHAVPLALLIMGRNAVAGRGLLSHGSLGNVSAWELALALLYVALVASAATAIHERVVVPMTRRIDARFRFWAPGPPRLVRSEDLTSTGGDVGVRSRERQVA